MTAPSVQEIFIAACRRCSIAKLQELGARPGLGARIGQAAFDSGYAETLRSSSPKSPKALALLLGAGADPSRPLPNIAGDRAAPLRMALDSPSKVRLLLAAGAMPDAEDDFTPEYGSPLAQACHDRAPEGVLAALLEAGAGPSKPNAQGYLSPITMAATSSNLEACLILARAGAALDDPACKEQTLGEFMAGQLFDDTPELAECFLALLKDLAFEKGRIAPAAAFARLYEERLGTHPLSQSVLAKHELGSGPSPKNLRPRKKRSI